MSSMINAAGPSALQVGYFNALEDANLPMTPAEGGSATIIWDGGQSSRSNPALPEVITSFSAEAQAVLSRKDQEGAATQWVGGTAVLSRQQIALQIISKSTYAGQHSSATVHNANQAKETSIAGSQLPLAKPSSTTGPNTSEPSIDQLKGMSATARFYTTISLQGFTTGMTPDEAAAFGAAYEAKTLNIQSAADVPQLNFRSSWTFTGSSTGTSEEGSFSFNSAWAKQQYGQYFVESDPIFGGTIISLGA